MLIYINCYLCPSNNNQHSEITLCKTMNMDSVYIKIKIKININITNFEKEKYLLLNKKVIVFKFFC